MGGSGSQLVSTILIELLNPIVGSFLAPILTLGATGGIIVIIGLYYFIHFLNQYPLPKELQERDVEDG
ncbi:MAG: hypothetical protein ACFFB0_03550 [Promethearchaeota archaeon]